MVHKKTFFFSSVFSILTAFSIFALAIYISVIPINISLGIIIKNTLILSFSIILFLKITHGNYFTPISFAIILYYIQPIMGYISNIFLSKSIHRYSTSLDFSEPVFIWLLFMTFFQIGIICSKYKKIIKTSKNDKKMIKINDSKKLKYFALLILFISMCTNIYLISKFRAIPLTLGNKLDSVRFYYFGMVDPFILRLVHSNFIFSAIFLYLFIKKGVKNIFVWTIFIIFIVISSIFYGDRVKLIYIGLFGIFCYFKFNPSFKFSQKVYKNLLFVVILLFLLYVVVVIGYHRGAFANVGRESIIGMVSQNFTEFRDFTYAQNNFLPHSPKLGPYLETATVFYSFVPRQILALFGINKLVVLSQNSFSYRYAEYIRWNISEGGGIRYALIGEMYFDFHYYGIIAMFLIGFIFGKLCHFFERITTDHYLFNSTLILIVFFSMFAMTSLRITFDFINVIVFPLLIIEILTKRHRVRTHYEKKSSIS